MTVNETKMCHLTARALRLMSVQDDAERDGDHDLVECLDAALGRLAEEAQRLGANIAEPAGHAMGEVNRVVAALIPDETDQEMTITRARSAWITAHAETVRAEAALEEAKAQRYVVDDNPTMARHIYAMRQHGHALLSMAEAELDVQLAVMPPEVGQDLESRLESLEYLEG